MKIKFFVVNAMIVFCQADNLGGGGFTSGANALQNYNSSGVSNNNLGIGQDANSSSANSIVNKFIMPELKSNQPEKLTNIVEPYANNEGSSNKVHNLLYGADNQGNSPYSNTYEFLDIFQRNVQIRSGLLLQRYGYNLFNNPSTFAPVQNIPVPSNYVIGPSDQIHIKAWGTIDVDYNVTVANDGTIFIPKVGQINVVGVKAGDMDSFLSTKVGKIYRNFSLTTNIQQIRTIQVNITGFAKRAGTYNLSALSTLTNAVFASGGPQSMGSLRHILVKRNGVIVADYDMYELLLKGDNTSDIRLLPGDIIYYKACGNQVAVYDGVKVPSIYEMKKGETVADLVHFAGGYTYNTQKNNIIIEKNELSKIINVYNYSFIEGLKEEVHNGDIIHFFKGANEYDNSVVLVGNVANPSRFQWKKGMHIRDIIPSKKMLLTRSFWDSYSFNGYAHDNILTQSGREKYRSPASMSSEQTLNTGMSSSYKYGNALAEFTGGDNLFSIGPIQIPEVDINWNYAVIVRINKDNYQSNLITFNLGRAIAGDKVNNIELQSGDIINILSAKDMRMSISNVPIYVYVDGEVNYPGVYELTAGSTLHDILHKAGDVTKNAYLFGIELDRQTVQKKQQELLNQVVDQLEQSILMQANNATVSSMNAAQLVMQNQVMARQEAFLNKMRQIKPSGRVVLSLNDYKVESKDLPNFVLENGDVVHIPAMPNSIDVIGQVYNPATFIYNSNKTVGDYINLAGATTRFADTSSIYVIKADGTLYSREQAGFFGSFYSLALNPGDAIVVPQIVQFSNITQDVLNWTQVLANFGLGVAAIKQLSN